MAPEPWVAFPPRSGALYEPYPWSLQHRLAASGLRPAEIIPIDSLTAQIHRRRAYLGAAARRLIADLPAWPKRTFMCSRERRDQCGLHA